MFGRFFLSSLVLLGSWTSLQANDEITLHSTANVTMSKYGMTWENTQVRALVKNLAYDKSVQVVFTSSDGSVTSVAANYVGPAHNGYELWEAFTNLKTGSGYKFYVDYTIAGQHFEDNNGGQTYELKDGPVFYQGQKIQQIFDGHQFSNYSASFAVAVENIAYQKNIRLHYSSDGFRTEQVADLSFQPSYSYGYGAIVSPTEAGFEIWSTTISPVADSVYEISYYFTYEVNQQLFVDNNFGHNYLIRRLP